MKKLSFNNSGISLHAVSMGKLHLIEYLTEDSGFNKSGYVEVSKLISRNAIALQYPAGQHRSHILSCQSPTGFYIKSRGQYFAITHVSQSSDHCNEHLKNRDLSVIATDNQCFHYVVNTQPVNFPAPGDH